MKTNKDIDSYIGMYPKDVQALLKKIRATIKKAAPQAEEAMSYGIPTFKLSGNLVHFGGFKKHVGFFAGGRVRSQFPKELSKYAGGKGTIQFPIDTPLPLGLITKIVKFRVKETVQKGKK